MDPLKQQYNEVLKRQKKADDFYNKASSEDADKWLPEYNKIIRNLGTLAYKIEKIEGRELTRDEYLEGFKEE